MKLLLTEDGSHTLFSEQFNEIYHSLHGAIRESQHVFINAGLRFILESQPGGIKSGEPIKIFELGFGTGLNALLTLIESQKTGTDIYYETIEPYPLTIGLVEELNYTGLMEAEKYRPAFHSMHLCAWNEVHEIKQGFNFKKLHQSIFDLALETDKFNLIYFDAFGPDNQPEMWGLEVMQKMFNMLHQNGTLVTYSSKSLFQRHLKQAGFSVEKLPGPPGKREMIRATKK